MGLGIIHSLLHSLHKYLGNSYSAPLSCLGQEQKTDVVPVTQESWFYSISWGSLADLGIDQGLALGIWILNESHCRSNGRVGGTPGLTQPIVRTCTLWSPRGGG